MTGTSSCGVALLVFKFLIFLAIASLSTGTKENSVGFLKCCFILKMLGYMLYFYLARNNRSVSSPVSQKMLSSFSMFMRSQCYQKRFESFSCFCIICQNCATFNKYYFVVLRPIFLVKSGDIVFQKNLLSVILLRFKFPKCYHFFCWNNFIQ